VKFCWFVGNLYPHVLPIMIDFMFSTLALTFLGAPIVLPFQVLSSR